MNHTHHVVMVWGLLMGLFIGSIWVPSDAVHGAIIAVAVLGIAMEIGEHVINLPPSGDPGGKNE